MDWISINEILPNDGQKCLVVFECDDDEEKHRWLSIDVFNDGNFEFITDWEDRCASVGVPDGTRFAKYKAICWVATELSSAPLTFDKFYSDVEEAN